MSEERNKEEHKQSVNRNVFFNEKSKESLRDLNVEETIFTVPGKDGVVNIKLQKQSAIDSLLVSTKDKQTCQKVCDQLEHDDWIRIEMNEDSPDVIDEPVEIQKVAGGTSFKLPLLLDAVSLLRTGGYLSKENCKSLRAATINQMLERENPPAAPESSVGYFSP